MTLEQRSIEYDDRTTFNQTFNVIFLTLTLFWGGGILTLYLGGGGGGKITYPILTAVLVVQLSSNLVRMSNCQSVLNFWEKKIKIFDDVIIIFWKKCLELFFFFLEMIFKHKTIFFFFFDDMT